MQFELAYIRYCVSRVILLGRRGIEDAEVADLGLCEQHNRTRPLVIAHTPCRLQRSEVCLELGGMPNDTKKASALAESLTTGAGAHNPLRTNFDVGWIEVLQQLQAHHLLAHLAQPNILRVPDILGRERVFPLAPAVQQALGDLKAQVARHTLPLGAFGCVQGFALKVVLQLRRHRVGLDTLDTARRTPW